MMRRLFILTLAVAAVGTAYGSSKSSKTTAGSDWSVDHAKIAQRLHEAARALVHKNPAGARVASQDVDIVLKWTASKPSLDIYATDKNGNTLGDFANALAANIVKRGAQDLAKDLADRVKTLQSRLGSGTSKSVEEENEEQPGAPAPLTFEQQEAADLAELNRLAAMHGAMD